MTHWPVMTAGGLNTRLQSHRTIKRIALSMAVSLGVGLGIAGIGTSVIPSDAQAQGGPPAAGVGADPVRLEDARPMAPLIGRLVARQAGTVAAQIAGPVLEMPIAVGDRVNAGDVIARLDTETLILEQQLAEADVAAGIARLEETAAQRLQAEQELNRLEGLRRSAAFSQARYDDQRQTVAASAGAERNAQAALARAEATLGLAASRLTDAVIRAPYPGVVTRRHTEIGAYVAAGSPVADIVNDQELEVEADVPTTLLAGLTPGAEINVDLAAMPMAVVRAVVPDENPRTRTRVVRFTPMTADGAAVIGADKVAADLAANQSVGLSVPAGAPGEVLTVAKDAVMAGSRGDMVFVAAEGVAQPRPVRLGRAVGDRFVVLDGLIEGDLAIVRGNERLRPGQPVNPMVNGAPVEQAPAAAPAADAPTEGTPSAEGGPAQSGPNTPGASDAPATATQSPDGSQSQSDYRTRTSRHFG